MLSMNEQGPSERRYERMNEKENFAAKWTPCSPTTPIWFLPL
jgi:hypothetical protein